MSLKFTVDPEIYGELAVLKATYRFTDRYFIKIEKGAVTFTPKGTAIDNNLEGKFFNELLDQRLREKIAQETLPARNLIMAYALSSLDTDGDAR